MAKTIIISEGMQNELNDILSMTQFKFKSNIKKFLAELLEDPIGAMPDMIFTHNGLDKNKLIKSLVDNKVINKKMTIDDHDADGKPHKAKMIVRYSVPKERFNDRLDALYDVLFPDVPAKINEDGGGATSCSGVDGNGFGSGEFIQPMGGVQRHPGDPKQKTKKRNTVGGDAYSVEINEAVTGDDVEKSVALYVYNEDGDHKWFILCARRSNRKGDEEGGKWNPPMGHLHKGESIKDGAIRECLEESGIDFSKYKSEICVNDHLEWGSNCILNLGDYVSPSVTIDDFKPGKGDDENSKFIWLPLEEIDTKTWAWTCGENAKKFIPGEIDLSESVNHGMLTENKESKMRSLARRYAKSKGYSDEQAKELEMTILHDIPNARLGNFKFFLGVTRLAVEGQLSDGQSIMKLNQYLKLLANPTHINEYDNNLNGMSFSEIDRRFATVQQQFNQEEMEKSNARQLTENSDYQIVKIPDAETASQYGRYTSWCVTHDEEMYDSYTGNGLGLFYFCLKNGFENVPKQVGENSPLDDYGLSMIAVSVNMDGSPNTITCRWNHDNGGDDNVMTPEQLEDIIGRGFYRTFLPYSREELHAKGKILFDEVQGLLESGADPREVFDWVDGFHEGIASVELNNKYNFINGEGQILSPDQWFDSVGDFDEGYAMVKLNDKFNFINGEGQLISDQWFDGVEYFSEGYALVKLNNKYNFINGEGHIVSDQWFDSVNAFREGYAGVKLNGKYNFINGEGQYLSDQWFDDVRSFSEGYAAVSLNGKWNFINGEGQLTSDQWFDSVGYFNEGFAWVRLNKKWNFINQEGQYLSDQWFEDAYDFKNGYARVQLNGKYNFINGEGQLISDQWFDDAVDFSEGYARVEINRKKNFINGEGQLISDQWFDSSGYSFHEGYAAVKLNGNWYYIDGEGILYDKETKQPIQLPNQGRDVVSECVKRVLNEFLHVRNDKNLEYLSYGDILNEDGGGAGNCAGVGLGGDNTVFGTGFLCSSDDVNDRAKRSVSISNSKRGKKRCIANESNVVNIDTDIDKMLSNSDVDDKACEIMDALNYCSDNNISIVLNWFKNKYMVMTNPRTGEKRKYNGNIAEFIANKYRRLCSIGKNEMAEKLYKEVVGYSGDWAKEYSALKSAENNEKRISHKGKSNSVYTQHFKGIDPKTIKR